MGASSIWSQSLIAKFTPMAVVFITSGRRCNVRWKSDRVVQRGERAVLLSIIVAPDRLQMRRMQITRVAAFNHVACDGVVF